MIGPLAAGMAAIAALALLVISGQRSPQPIELVPGAVLTQPFGCTGFELEPIDVSCPGGHFHAGIDLAAPAGTPVRTPGDGLAAVGEGGPCGIHVTVAHGGGMVTLFCHLAEATVHSGQRVRAGDRVGSVGSTGNSTGPHLHLEVHAEGRPVDPAAWLRRLPVSTADAFRGGR